MGNNSDLDFCIDFTEEERLEQLERQLRRVIGLQLAADCLWPSFYNGTTLLVLVSFGNFFLLAMELKRND